MDDAVALPRVHILHLPADEALVHFYLAAMTAQFVRRLKPIGSS